jgi:hypothetical protein
LKKLNHWYKKLAYVFVALVLCAVFFAVPQDMASAMPFNTAVNYAVGTGPRSVAVGDFNGGGLDLAEANGTENNVGNDINQVKISSLKHKNTSFCVK